MTVLIISLGFLFGLFLQYAKVNTYNSISGMAVLNDFTVAKTIAAAIGIGAIVLSMAIGLGYADFHIKPFLAGAVIIGGLLFGIGMAILGYCPGTLPVSLGQGSLDALIGILGGLAASLLYTLLSPTLHGTIGPDMGKIALSSLVQSGSAGYYILAVIIGSGLIAAAFWLQRKEKKKELNWLVAAAGIAAIAVSIFIVSDRVLGASTFYPYIADRLTGLTDNAYYIKQVEQSGFYEMKFLAGAFLSGLVYSIIKGEFKIRLLHDNWIRMKGSSSAGRIFWAFTGGFLLLFGARLAGGCTSGHIISGGIQLAVSSWVFAVFVFASFLLTGHFFYRNAK
ncbi:MAG TPA: YeeE/YedE thiosulfate transporter family protein [Chitinophagaceae bacterium]|nr:YeeE/YedE thiosulfate transporter family protein [Chitinophagaceae bacterium]